MVQGIYYSPWSKFPELIQNLSASFTLFVRLLHHCEGTVNLWSNLPVSWLLQILDDVFASQMQKLQGRALQEKDLEPPRSVAEARSMLSRDTRNGADSFY